MPHLRALPITPDGGKYGFDLGQVSPLLRAAPNLTTLHLRKVYARDLPYQLKLKKVIYLEILGGMDGSELVSMLQLCPSVEELRYDCGYPFFGYEQFTPREAANTVIAHAPHLKKMELDLIEWRSEYEPGLGGPGG